MKLRFLKSNDIHVKNDFQDIDNEECAGLIIDLDLSNKVGFIDFLLEFDRTPKIFLISIFNEFVFSHNSKFIYKERLNLDMQRLVVTPLIPLEAIH